MIVIPPRRARNFYDMHSEMNRVFEEMFGAPAHAGRQQGDQPTQWTPLVDVLQDNGDLLIRAELPGVKRDDVELTLHERVLTISGERRAEEQREGSSYYVRERPHGSFQRSLVLPHDVEESEISAQFEDGVLEIRVPGGAMGQVPSRIEIQGPRGEGTGS
jgi:HSP20 family protein